MIKKIVGIMGAASSGHDVLLPEHEYGSQPESDDMKEEDRR